MRINPARPLLLLLVLLSAACAAVPGFQPPPRLYTLTPADAFPPDLPRVDRQLLVETPSAPAGLDTARIALRTAPTNLDYFANVNWTDRAPAMVQSLIVASFENAGRISVGRDSAGLRSDFLLVTELRDFQAEYPGQPGDQAPTVRVTVNAKLVAMPRRTIEASQTFEVALPAASAAFEAVIAAWDQAIHDVMGQLVGWTLGRIPQLVADRPGAR